MLKNIFEKMMQQDPDEKHRYVFINDNMEIMQNVAAIGYSALWLTEAEKNAFSLDGFKDKPHRLCLCASMFQEEDE